MQTTKERREALKEYMQLISKLPENGTRISFSNSSDQQKKPTNTVSLTKTEQMYRH